jgi:hypothetical protein
MISEQQKLNQFMKNELDSSKVKLEEINRTNHHWYSLSNIYKNQLQSVYNSTSWRITMPPRKLKQFARGLLIKVRSNTRKLPFKLVSKNDSVKTLQNLPPTARRIYGELKSTIEKRNKK